MMSCDVRMSIRVRWWIAAVVCMFGVRCGAAEPVVSLRSDFAGGNVVVVSNDGRTVHLKPDLRGGASWFYWHFEARVEAAGPVEFVFEGAPMIGVRGPAVSLDGGRRWNWLGADGVRYAAPGTPGPRSESFRYDFAGAGQAVRFAVAVPYLDRDLNEFLDRHAGDGRLRRTVFARSRSGRPIELLEVGAAGPGVEPVLLTARHHACESMASYVLEGWIEEALSDSPAGRDFRNRYVLYAVPMVDKDGVEAGDQGKNRSPHDHNRDYGEQPIYPEVRAIQSLAEAQRIRYSVDLHCPALRGDVHEAFHFLGLGLPHVRENLDEWIAWIREERPPAASAPLNFLADPAKPGAIDRRINAHYFALRKSAVFAATLEIPYAQPTCPLDAEMARRYGAALLRAWTRTKFRTRDDHEERGRDGSATLLAVRDGFLKSFRSRPEEAETRLREYASDESALRPESSVLLATLRLHQRRFDDVVRLCDSVLVDPHGTQHQRVAARLLLVQAAAGDARTTEADVARRLDELSSVEYPSNDVRAKAFEAVAAYYHREQRIDAAIEFARRQTTFAAIHEQGTILNRIAGWYDESQRPEEAVAARREVVSVLRPRLAPRPQRSIFGATMALDYFEALCRLPSATREERTAAAEMILEHDVVTPGRKEEVRRRLVELERP